jgi:uncharacterized protein YcbK (DUF882 family)
VVVSAKWRLVVVGGASRSTREVRFATGLTAVLLWLTIGLPLGAGVLLGARHAKAQRHAPSLWSLAALASADMQPISRRAPYVVLARSTALPVAPTFEPPPAPPEPVLGLVPKTPEHRRGHFRMASMRHPESIDVVPWNEHGERDEAAFLAISHLFRCRITGHELPIDEHLVKLLTKLNDLYDKPLYLISGHRVPYTIDTSPTSQHTMGTAADVRIPGVSIDELREVALELGARGVGLYTHKQFVHIDFRAQRKYQWTDATEGSEAEGGSALLVSIKGS